LGHARDERHHGQRHVPRLPRLLPRPRPRRSRRPPSPLRRLPTLHQPICPLGRPPFSRHRPPPLPLGTPVCFSPRHQLPPPPFPPLPPLSLQHRPRLRLHGDSLPSLSPPPLQRRPRPPRHPPRPHSLQSPDPLLGTLC
jgi:hypothetical protein